MLSGNREETAFSSQRTGQQEIMALGEKTGFVFGYFLSTTLLFGTLSFLHKLPQGWGYAHIMGIMLAIVAVGTLLKGALK